MESQCSFLIQVSSQGGAVVESLWYSSSRTGGKFGEVRACPPRITHIEVGLYPIFVRYFNDGSTHFAKYITPSAEALNFVGMALNFNACASGTTYTAVRNIKVVDSLTSIMLSKAHWQYTLIYSTDYNRASAIEFGANVVCKHHLHNP